MSCFYCQRGLVRGGGANTTGRTRDHIIPRSRGGTGESFNLVPCCRQCNNSKNDLLPAEWAKKIQYFLKQYRSLRGFNWKPKGFALPVPLERNAHLILKNIERAENLPHVIAFRKANTDRAIDMVYAVDLKVAATTPKPTYDIPTHPVNFHEEYWEKMLPPKVTARNQMAVRVGK